MEIKAIKLKLSQYCTVYQAELLAIQKATEEIGKIRTPTFAIFSDSMAALQTIQNPNALHPLAVQTRENLHDLSLQGKVVILFWIKAHAGLKGNERADHLAKEAALKSKRRPDYDQCPISFVKRSIRTETLEEWNTRYAAGDTASVTKIFFPNAKTAYRVVRKFNATRLTTQILTGHGGFSEYLHRFKCKASPSCICDPGIDENVNHLLFECPVFGRIRSELECELEMEINSGTAEIIMQSKKREKFLTYCSRITEMVTNRNKTS
ncbi:uncharacterized protein LOC124540370 [Vanessa cardui]|uniref:uncharacterized protein LOC124540370 n=1 Tax=Vanessa cardui TaxID=171605 RepID=UPI001F13CB70|nr:uncharacterized protein LOC124540370 [Vanessa cardui]